MAMAAVAAARAASRGGGLCRFLSTSINFPPLSGGGAAAADAPRRQQNEPSTNLFISGLNKRTTSEGLKEAFLKFGEVVYARVVTDRVTGYSRGFGFVRYSTIEDAAKGIAGMDAQFLDGWVIFAEYARPRAPPTSPPETSGSYPAYSSNA
ncbi:hypothetical protein QJS04_geneDACA019053 [Acorus gramineus]|uniref:RRM domain-containing protein n=1 Tax=Acorus gramineus TaxID=55184 RepID=A0AAV9A7Q3_ACOGR|nr:hypothetical protein QJS04_geneDACA019053 [Acorus gramineus]